MAVLVVYSNRSPLQCCVLPKDRGPPFPHGGPRPPPVRLPSSLPALARGPRGPSGPSPRGPGGEGKSDYELRQMMKQVRKIIIMLHLPVVELSDEDREVVERFAASLKSRKEIVALLLLCG